MMEHALGIGGSLCWLGVLCLPALAQDPEQPGPRNLPLTVHPDAERLPKTADAIARMLEANDDAIERCQALRDVANDHWRVIRKHVDTI